MNPRTLATIGLFVFSLQAAAAGEVSSQPAMDEYSRQGDDQTECSPAAAVRSLGRPENEVQATLYIKEGLNIDPETGELSFTLDQLDLKLVAIAPEGQVFAENLYPASDFLSAERAEHLGWVLERFDYLDQLLSGRELRLTLASESGSGGTFDVTITGVGKPADEQGPIRIQFRSEQPLPSGMQEGSSLRFAEGFPLAHVRPLMYQASEKKHYYPCEQGSHCSCCFGSVKNCTCWWTDTSLGHAYGGCCPTPQCLRCISPVGNCPCNCC